MVLKIYVILQFEARVWIRIRMVRIQDADPYPEIKNYMFIPQQIQENWL